MNIDELLVSQPDTGEQAMEICEALRVPTVPFRLIPPLRKGVFARRICGPAFP